MPAVVPFAHMTKMATGMVHIGATEIAIGSMICAYRQLTTLIVEATMPALVPFAHTTKMATGRVPLGATEIANGSMIYAKH